MATLVVLRRHFKWRQQTLQNSVTTYHLALHHIPEDGDLCSWIFWCWNV